MIELLGLCGLRERAECGREFLAERGRDRDRVDGCDNSPCRSIGIDACFVVDEEEEEEEDGASGIVGATL